MQSVVHSVSLRGVDVVPVSVQAHISNGLPAMAIVGLADKSVTESKERVRSALSLWSVLPAKRLAINLAPADVLKEGAHFDLPIAMAVLLAMGVLPADALDGFIVRRAFSALKSIKYQEFYLQHFMPVNMLLD